MKSQSKHQAAKNNKSILVFTVVTEETAIEVDQEAIIKRIVAVIIKMTVIQRKIKSIIQTFRAKDKAQNKIYYPIKSNLIILLSQTRHMKIHKEENQQERHSHKSGYTVTKDVLRLLKCNKMEAAKFLRPCKNKLDQHHSQLISKEFRDQLLSLEKNIPPTLIHRISISVLVITNNHLTKINMFHLHQQASLQKTLESLLLLTTMFLIRVILLLMLTKKLMEISMEVMDIASKQQIQLLI